MAELAWNEDFEKVLTKSSERTLIGGVALLGIALWQIEKHEINSPTLIGGLIVGAIILAIAGAALTYGMAQMKKEIIVKAIDEDLFKKLKDLEPYIDQFRAFAEPEVGVRLARRDTAVHSTPSKATLCVLKDETGDSVLSQGGEPIHILVVNP